MNVRRKLQPRTYIPLAGLLAVLAAAPTASAGSLLSGYSGPGGGAQVIVGATLLPGGGGQGGGGQGGGGQGGGGAAAQTGGASLAAAGGTAPAVSGGSAGPRPAHAVTSASGGHVHGTRVGASSAVATPVVDSTPVRDVAASSSGGTRVLGLSIGDLLLVLLAAGALILTAGLTRRLTRAAG
jgi:hypothetical protein